MRLVNAICDRLAKALIEHKNEKLSETKKSTDISADGGSK